MGGEIVKPTTDYGKAVRQKLIAEEKTQRWLEEQITEKTGLYCDRSLLNRIFTGEMPGKKIVSAINEILDMG